MVKLDKGRFITLLITSLLVFWYYFDCIIHINSKLLTGGSDGLQAYYTSLYHLKFDSTYWHFKGMNYPYGESVFYTNGQPLIINFLKLIQPIFDLSNYVVAILNLLVLISFVVCSNYIYLIFRYLKIDTLWSVLFALAITFLSPQLTRVNGHLTLAYICAIPMFIYYVLKFTDDISYPNSIKLGLIALFFLFIHPYFVVFYCFILFPFYLFLLYYKKIKLIAISKHFSIQLLVPILLFLVLQDSNIQDRPKFPLGFLEYKASWQGVFFSQNAVYSDVYKSFKFEYPQWEGTAYIGLFAVLSSVFIVCLFFWNSRRLKIKEGVIITDKWQLNLLLFCALVALFFSFAFPFNIAGYNYYLKYAGPIRQFRGIGRFSWLFFYVINILAIYLLFSLLKNKKPLLKNSILAACLLLLTLDIYSNLKSNKRVSFDKSMFVKQDFWSELKSIKTNEFQAIIPMPYFHVGSENVSLDPNSSIKQYVFSISTLTGLPITAVNLSRTSLSQTYENLALISETYKPLPYLKKCNQKPFLVIVRTNELSPHDIEFVTNCSLIKKTKEFDIYKITPKELVTAQKKLYAKINESIKHKTWFKNQDYLLSDTTQEIIFNGIKSHDKINFVNSRFDFTEINKYQKIGEFAMNSNKEKKYQLSFWVENFTQELIPRTHVELTYFDKEKKVIQFDFFSFYERIQILDNKSALIQAEMNLPEGLDSLKFYMWNEHIVDPKATLHLKNIMIKPINVDIYKKINENTFFLNNRIYESKSERVN